ncbi:MAG: hypothetical protein KDH98_24505, partial [Calditrichaeota bacterium]|nr:hypothetical protein [Calditrichota bacterium]
FSIRKDLLILDLSPKQNRGAESLRHSFPAGFHAPQVKATPMLTAVGHLSILVRRHISKSRTSANRRNFLNSVAQRSFVLPVG